MMENKKKVSGRFHEIIKTKRVYIEGNQVFTKEEVDETFLEHVPEWFPTDFNWMPVRL